MDLIGLDQPRACETLKSITEWKSGLLSVSDTFLLQSLPQIRKCEVKKDKIVYTKKSRVRLSQL